MVACSLVSELTNCGLTSEDANDLAKAIVRLSGSNDEELAWTNISKQLLNASLPPAVLPCVHRWVFRYYKYSRPAPAWIPRPAEDRETNISRILRDLQIDSYTALYKWSIDRRGEFWDYVIRRLGINFRQAYKYVLDPLSSAKNQQWLHGARLNIVESCFQATDDAIAIRQGGPDGEIIDWTYGRLRELTARINDGLQRFGVTPGDAVAICMPMTAESVAIYLGVISLGAVAVPIVDSFAAPEIATRLRIGGAKVLFTQDTVLRGGQRIALYNKVCSAGGPPTIVVPCHASLGLNLRAGDAIWPDFLLNGKPASPVSREPDDCTSYLFSSGTTAEPKAIPWNQVTPVKCAMDGHMHQDIQVGDIVAWPTNLGWMMGPWLIFASLINRATIALFCDAPTGRPFGEFISRAGVTMLGVIPSLVATWKRSGCMAGLDWSAINCFSSTGECSNPADMLYLMSLAGWKPVIEYCGGTELAGGYISGTLVQPQAAGFFSTPTLGSELRILDQDGCETTFGEVFLTPPVIGMSTTLLNGDHDQVYFAHAPITSDNRVLRRHGDQLEQLPGGYFRAHGRTDDTMNLSGIKVSSAEIEQALNKVPGVCESAAVGVPPLGGGPCRLVVFVVLEESLEADAEEIKAPLQQAIRVRLNPLYRIHDVEIVKALPRTASNKIMRRELRRRYCDSDGR